MDKLLSNAVQLIIQKGITERVEMGDCPQGGDSMDCNGCAYNGEYFFLNGICASKKCEDSRWGQLTADTMYSGTNDEYVAIKILGKKIDSDTEEDVVLIWSDLSNNDSPSVSFVDDIDKDDFYVLSVVYEQLCTITM